MERIKKQTHTFVSGILILRHKLDGAARYAGLLLAPVEGFGLGLFPPSGKKVPVELLLPFLCSAVTIVTLKNLLYELEISSDELEISSDQLEVSPDQLTV